jgi:hypothetical protein
MKARQKHRETGPTTGCCPDEDTCIEQKQRVRQKAVMYSKKQTKKEQFCTYTDTKVRMLGESDVGKQLSGIHRKENEQTCIFVYLCMCTCMRSENESASHSSPPQLKGVRVISPCAHAGVCPGTILLISLLCLFVGRAHRDTKTHTHTSNT